MVKTKLTLSLKFKEDEIMEFKSIIDMLHDKPHTIGFSKNSFTEKQQGIIERIYNQFNKQPEE